MDTKRIEALRAEMQGKYRMESVSVGTLSYLLDALLAPAASEPKAPASCLAQTTRPDGTVLRCTLEAGHQDVHQARSTVVWPSEPAQEPERTTVYPLNARTFVLEIKHEGQWVLYDKDRDIAAQGRTVPDVFRAFGQALVGAIAAELDKMPATDSPDRPERCEPGLSDGPMEPVAGAHPELTCQRCGGMNPTPWFADNPLWNSVVGGEGGIWCPNCFIAEAQRQGHIPRVTVAKTQLVPVDPTIPREYGQQYRLCQIEECESDEESGENHATVCGKCYEKVAPVTAQEPERCDGSGMVRTAPRGETQPLIPHRPCTGTGCHPVEPAREAFPPGRGWRCEACGEMAEDVPDTAWRWAGDRYQHLHGQAGHFDAWFFGEPAREAEPTITTYCAGCIDLRARLAAAEREIAAWERCAGIVVMAADGCDPGDRTPDALPRLVAGRITREEKRAEAAERERDEARAESLRMRKISGKEAEVTSRLSSALKAAERRVEELTRLARNGVAAVESLIAESRGVIGLHLTATKRRGKNCADSAASASGWPTSTPSPPRS